MKRESRTVDRSDQVDSLTQRHLPLVDLLVDTRSELMELAVASGLKVLQTMLEDDRTAICGQRYQHQVERQASRAGTVPSEVVLGGRKVALRRPRVRANGEEVPLPTFRAMASEDPLRHVWGDVSLSMFRRGGILRLHLRRMMTRFLLFHQTQHATVWNRSSVLIPRYPLLPQFDSGKCLKCFSL